MSELFLKVLVLRSGKSVVNININVWPILKAIAVLLNLNYSLWSIQVKKSEKTIIFFKEV